MSLTPRATRMAMTPEIDASRTFKSPAVVAHRRTMLKEPHCAPLTAFVGALRHSGLDVPDFDPFDGGVNARFLFVHESPGKRARGKTGSGFISQNNDDQSAATFFRLRVEVGLERQQTAMWNIVPEYCGATSNESQLKRSDIQAGAARLLQVVELMPRLEVIILCGRKAQLAASIIRETLPNIEILSMPHCSPTNLNRRPQDRETIRQVLSKLVGR